MGVEFGLGVCAGTLTGHLYTQLRLPVAGTFLTKAMLLLNLTIKLNIVSQLPCNVACLRLRV
jgi:hypothetical protein